MSDLPQPDRVDGAPHPRETSQVIGHDAAAASFLDSFSSGRMHHAWMLQGPRGIGKASFAYQIARFLIATPPLDDGGMFGAPEPPTSLHIADDHPVARRILAGSDPSLFVLRRAVDDKDNTKLKTVITVDEARKLKEFLSLSATDGATRVVIVDAADEMNIQTANAILKVLEEPPANTVFLLICHQPSKLLPTIRSRCRTLNLSRLNPQDMERALRAANVPLPADTHHLTTLSDGSVGEALRLINLGGLDTYADLVDLLQNAPGLDRGRLLKMAEGMVGRGKAPKFELFLGQIDVLLSRIARAGLMGPPEAEAAPREASLLVRLCASPHAAREWAGLQQEIGARLRHGRAVNLDPAALVLDTGLKIDQAAARLAAKR
ncbi:DNA polymerase III subunit delta' [Nereida sp. MMG025]|uniref:DNA polymerase III subunit delta' n=1 Tax=Nereida sp. MMG025 TaxID=2909981 RepID=UPI001F3D59C3|nr:DNA polymerase III subunit delta' [Nereida sp. MMG025]MCF6443764.1 DNA polymerase III subunit delta' [Nereida sp. MMG025]